MKCVTLPELVAEGHDSVVLLDLSTVLRPGKKLPSFPADLQNVAVCVLSDTVSRLSEFCHGDHPKRGGETPDSVAERAQLARAALDGIDSGALAGTPVRVLLRSHAIVRRSAQILLQGQDLIARVDLDFADLDLPDVLVLGVLREIDLTQREGRYLRAHLVTREPFKCRLVKLFHQNSLLDRVSASMNSESVGYRETALSAGLAQFRLRDNESDRPGARTSSPPAHSVVMDTNVLLDLGIPEVAAMVSTFDGYLLPHRVVLETIRGRHSRNRHVARRSKVAARSLLRGARNPVRFDVEDEQSQEDFLKQLDMHGSASGDAPRFPGLTDEQAVLIARSRELGLATFDAAARRWSQHYFPEVVIHHERG